MKLRIVSLCCVISINFYAFFSVCEALPVTRTMTCNGPPVYGHAVFDRFDFAFTALETGSSKRPVEVKVYAHKPSDEDAKKYGYWTDDTDFENPIASITTSLDQLSDQRIGLNIIGYAWGEIMFFSDANLGGLLGVYYSYEVFDAFSIFSCDKYFYDLFD
jgi:hypothetical protein